MKIAINKDKGIKIGLKFVVLIFAVFMATQAFSFQTVKQFEETSYYLKDICLIDSKVGWAVGEPHWDQIEKRYKGTIIKTLDGGENWTSQEADTNETLKGVSFVDANNGWTVGTNGTILHTSDGGNHWIKQAVATSDEFRGVAFADVNNGWATSIAPSHFDYWGDTDAWRGSIWHTYNGGQTWFQQPVPSDTGILNRIKFVDSKNGWAVGIKNGDDPSAFFPSSFAAIYHTDNGGDTWKEQYSPNLEIVFTGVDFVDAKNGWVVGFKVNSDLTGGSIFHTTDGGLTWVRQAQDQSFYETFWDVQFIDSRKGYVVGFDYASAQEPPVYRTQDGGVTWEKVLMAHNDLDGLFGVAVRGDRVIGVGDHDFVCISTDPWGTSELSWDLGKQLFSQKYINTHYDFHDIFFLDEQSGWAVGRRSYSRPRFWGQLVWHTQDGGRTWTTQYEKAPNFDNLYNYTQNYMQLNSVCFTDSRNGWAVGTSESIDNEGGWEHHDAILHTRDGGLHWEEQGSELYAGWDLEFFSVQFLDSDNGWALPSGRFPYPNIFLARTTDGGSHWDWVDTGIKTTLFDGDISFTDPQHGFVAGTLEKVIKTEDGGAHWVEQDFHSYPPSGALFYAVDFLNSQQGWIAGEGLYYTTNGGSTWVQKDIGIDTDFRDVQFQDSQHGWLVGNSGVMMNTTDGGNTWNSVASGTNFDLLGASFPNSQKGWAVGDHGAIIAINPGSDNQGDEVAITAINLSPADHLQAGAPVTVTANAAGANEQTIYYKFYYYANYGTDDYLTTPWTVVQDYSTDNSAEYIFPSAGNYIIVVRAVTDPDHEPASLPIIGQAVVVGDDSQVSLAGMTVDAATATNAGDPVTVTASAVGPEGRNLYYQFYYCANYGTPSYANTRWTLVQPYSASNTCQYTFPADGNYIIVVRAVTDPDDEPPALPIVGSAITIGDPVTPGEWSSGFTNIYGRRE